MKFGELKTYSEKPDKITTSDIINLLEHKYNRTDNRGEWNGFAEVSDGCGWNKTGGIDFWAIHNWAGNQRFAYEIKISRGDFLKEMKNPKKRRKALLVSNFYFFIAPEGLLKIEEIPPECGLKEVYWKTNQSEIDSCERSRNQLFGGKATEEESADHSEVWSGSNSVLKKRTADFVMCALRIANTAPGGAFDLQETVLQRMREVNGTAPLEKEKEAKA